MHDMMLMQRNNHVKKREEFIILLDDSSLGRNCNESKKKKKRENLARGVAFVQTLFSLAPAFLSAITGLEPNARTHLPSVSILLFRWANNREREREKRLGVKSWSVSNVWSQLMHGWRSRNYRQWLCWPRLSVDASTAGQHIIQCALRISCVNQERTRPWWQLMQDLVITTSPWHSFFFLLLLPFFLFKYLSWTSLHTWRSIQSKWVKADSTTFNTK